MRSITLILPFYQNPTMLARQCAALAAMPEHIRRCIKLIVVDDGSPEPAVLSDAGVEASLYRIGVDKRWNQDAARNLGVDRAEDGWVLMTDIDHLTPEKTFAAIIRMGLDERKVYKFGRVSEPDMSPYKSHPNSWLMTRAMFDRIGGYDERFAGYYGTDGDFRDSVMRHAEIVTLKEVLVRVPREVTQDASTTNYLRKQPEDTFNIPRIRNERAKIPNWRPLRGTCPWSRVV